VVMLLWHRNEENLHSSKLQLQMCQPRGHHLNFSRQENILAGVSSRSCLCCFRTVG
jgi:hypothetical protein